MNQLVKRYVGVVGQAEVISQKTITGLFYAHLLHLGPRREAHLHTDHFMPARFFASPDFPLNIRCIVHRHIRVVIGYLSNLIGL